MEPGSSVHFALITKECCISSAKEFLYVGPGPHLGGMVMTSSLNSLELPYMALLKLVFSESTNSTLQHRKLGALVSGLNLS